MDKINLMAFIDDYGFNKSELDKHKKICDELNPKIKAAMESEQLSDFQGDFYSAKYVVKTSVSFIEDKLLEVIKSSGRQDLIKTREYVDTDALESALYHGEIPQDIIVQIRNCQVIKQTPTLAVKARKK